MNRSRKQNELLFAQLHRTWSVGLIYRLSFLSLLLQVPAFLHLLHHNMTKTGLTSLPPELITYIASFLIMPDLGNYAATRLHVFRPCSKVVERHSRVLSYADSKGWKIPTIAPTLGSHLFLVPANQWQGFLVALLEDPELSRYVTCANFQVTTIERPVDLGTRVLQPHEKRLVRDRLASIPGLRQEDSIHSAILNAFSDSIVEHRISR